MTQLLFLLLTIIFGVISITTFIIALWRKEEDNVKMICSIICWISFALAAITGTCIAIAPRGKAKEFPATKYELKYKVTEFDGVSDTTYVIIPKK